MMRGMALKARLRLSRATTTIVGVAALAASLLVGGAANAAVVGDDDTLSGGVVSDGPGPDTVQFPDGTYVEYPTGSLTITRTVTGTSTELPDGTTIDVRNAGAGGITPPAVYPPVTIWYSRAAVEEMWRAKNNINNVCRVLPLSFFASLGCSAPGNLADALDQAHYQQKRIKALYYQCIGATYCSYYTYTVAA